MAEESVQKETALEGTAGKRQKVPLEVLEQRLAPKPSFWPIILALTLIVAFIGVMMVNLTPLVFGLGVVLAILAVIGWMLEKH